MSEKRRAINVDDTIVNFILNENPTAVGQKVKIASYNIVSGKYSIFFPADNEIIETTLDQDLQIIQ